MEININDVLTLKDNRKFLVLSETIYNDNKYYYLIELTKDGEEIVDHVKIVKTLANEKGSRLITVLDPDEIDNVKEDLVANLDKNDFN